MDLQKFSQKLEGFRSASPESQDLRLENECMLLLARMEMLLEKLETKTTQGDTNGALETGKELLVELLEFLMQRFGNDSVARDLTPICELRDSIRDLQSLLSRSFWANLFRTESSHHEVRIQAYRQIGHDFVDVLRDLLSVVDGHFHSPVKIADWRSSSRVLVEDFRQRWEG